MILLSKQKKTKQNKTKQKNKKIYYEKSGRLKTLKGDLGKS